MRFGRSLRTTARLQGLVGSRLFSVGRGQTKKPRAGRGKSMENAQCVRERETRWALDVIPAGRRRLLQAGAFPASGLSGLALCEFKKDSTAEPVGVNLAGLRAAVARTERAKFDPGHVMGHKQVGLTHVSCRHSALASTGTYDSAGWPDDQPNGCCRAIADDRPKKIAATAPMPSASTGPMS
jgi:hypothetical protein